jgi:uncharacterized OB-fold protein
MTFLERTTKPENLRSWRGDVEADYRYTSGVAGERFFLALRDAGKIFAATCDACELTYLPPRMYCEVCMGPLVKWSEVTGSATVEGVTVTHVDEHGERLASPQVWAILRWPGIHGGLVHRLAVPPDQARPGLKVRPVLRARKERVGNITDIVEFAVESPPAMGRKG